VIYRMADNPDASEVIERYWDLIDALRRQFGFSPNFMSKVIADHRHVLDAIARRDAETAIALVAQSCERSKIDLIEQIRSHRSTAPAGAFAGGKPRKR